MLTLDCEENMMTQFIFPSSSNSTIHFFGIQYVAPETNWFYPNHRHMGFELLYCESGQIAQSVNGREYVLKPGEAIIISPQTFHQTESVTDNTLFFDLLFDVEIPVLYSLFHQLSNQKIKLSTEQDHAFSIQNWIKEIVTNFQFYLNKSSDLSISPFAYHDITSSLNMLQLQAKLLEFVYELGNYLAGMEMVQMKSESKPSSSIKLANEATYLLETHLYEGIQIQDLAKKLAVDRSYLTQCFKQVYGVSPKSYLIQIRIRETKRLLEGTDLSIDEIAVRLCFSSSSHLNRSFQHILGMTPSEFRNHFQKRMIIEEV
jgi:AraC-like DNA-binding protein